ncbi:outer membrane beta-barrel family protein [Chitinophaga sancti]|uniref:Outer membrane receptor proteins, mostly Fe transport n=1 Tax=Chitinophaga sancti TaxID=1004 RepID=A0A1K1R3F2_9BACT|nr:outer membrane beta-barrel family protein [Chitinophaga sancti]WQD64295.1 TonB-dependent receptor [Chitinophaga sancti]WQG90081.1 TonB-dependent receptor [Chitinophaga sancti]SFW66679.1 Outer membrane receptor proteins, mostly Fe transport [Chitinophaga sancti]
MNYKLLSFFINLVTIFIIHPATAQQAQISGTVIDEKGQPLPFSAVALFSASDETKIVSNTLSDTEGKYQFTQLPEGHYYIKVSALGYTPTRSPLIILDPGAKYAAIPLVMNSTPTNLNVVEIAGKKATIENKGDRFVVNTEKSALAAGNAIDLLKSTPFVSLSASNEIRLQGKKTMFLVDGKPLPASSMQEILQMIPAGNISSIELITNPSSKYDAAYGAVINIITRKKELEGTTGNLRADAAQGKYGNYNFNGRLTYKKKSITLFSMAGYNKSDQQSFNGSDRILDNSEKPDLLQEDITRTFHQHFYNLQTGGEWTINNNQTLGVLTTGRIIRSKGDFISDNRFSKENSPVDSALYTRSPFENKGSIFNYNINYHLLADSGKNDLTVLATFTPYKSDFKQTFYSELNDGRTPPVYKNTNHTDIQIYIAQVDYIHKFSHHWLLDAGLKYQNTNSRNSILYEDNRNGGFAVVPEYSSDNHLKESIAAGYAILSKNWSSTKLQMGLRAENTDASYVGYFNQHAIKLFPSLSYEYKISDQYSLTLSYKKTINRAPYNELVPYTIFVNQNTVFRGNPSLQPQYDNILTLSTRLHQLSIAFIYTLSKNMFGQFPIAQDFNTKTTWFALQNLNDAQDFHIDLFYPLQITRWWSAQNSGSIFGYSKASGFVMDKSFTLSSNWVNLKTDQTFDISKRLKLEIIGYYNSKMTSELTSLGSYGNIDASLLINVLNGQLRIGGNDILKRNVYWSGQDFGVYRSSKDRYMDSRRLSIGYTYNFGRTKIATPGRKLGNNDALQRIQ